MKDFLLVAGLLAAPATVSVQQYHASPEVKQNDPRLSRLQKFFGDRDCPLRDSAKDFLIAADQNQLDWRLLPSISIIESSGGKDYTNNNVFGWGSAKEKFTSVRAGNSLRRRTARKIKKIQGQEHRWQAADLQSPARIPAARVKAVMRAIGSCAPRLLAAD